MGPVLPWIAAYLAILLGWTFIVLRRTGPTLWKGHSLVALNLAFVAISTAASVLEARSLGRGIGEVFQCCVSRGIIVFDLVLFLAALALGRQWLLIGIGRADLVTVLERCFRQTRATSTGRDDGFAVQCGDAEMRVTITPTPIGLLSVRFTGGTESKKAALVRKLFGKQFHSSFPTPRLRA